MSESVTDPVSEMAHHPATRDRLNRQGEFVGTAFGKLYILGEYAVVYPGEPAVIAAVDRLLHVELRTAAGPGYIHETHRGKHYFRWQRKDAQLQSRRTKSGKDYLLRALDWGQRFVTSNGQHLRYADVYVDNELIDASGKKLGLGSSAAIVVATLRAMIKFYGIEISALELYKLAMLVSSEVSPQSSGGDIAAAIYGGWIAYHSPDRDWIIEQRQTLAVNGDGGAGVFSMLTRDWPGLRIGRLPGPTESMMVGWTQTPASSPELVTALTSPSAEAGARSQNSADTVTASATDPDMMYAFRRQSRELVQRFISGDMAAITDGRELMADIGQLRRVTIETQQLRNLCDTAEQLGGRAKVSGAGGGDCGIAFFDEVAASRVSGELRQRWQLAGIKTLDLRVSPPSAELAAYPVAQNIEGHQHEH